MQISDRSRPRFRYHHRNTSRSRSCSKRRFNPKGICVAVDRDLLESPREIYFCASAGCIDAGNEIMSSLDTSVNACVDFYQYACGGWMKNHAIPKKANHFSVFSKFQDDLPEQLRDMFAEQLNQGAPLFIRVLKKIYDTCMDEAKINKEGSVPLRKILNDDKKWPVLEGSNWTDTSFNWLLTLINFRTNGFNHNILFDLSVAENPINRSTYIIKLGYPSFALNPEYLLAANDSFRRLYLTLMSEVPGHLVIEDNFVNFTVWNRSVQNELNEIINFEIKLANISHQFEKRRPNANLYETHTIQTLIDQMPQVSWLHYFKSILKTDINASEPFIIGDLNFLKEVISLINQTEKRVLANYIMWRLVHESLPLLAPRYSSTRKLMSWENIITPRWRYCISLLNESLGMALHFNYIRHYMGNETAAFTKILNLTTYIREAYKTILQQFSPSIHTATVQEAIRKADSVTFDISYKTEYLNDSYVSQIYENLSVINLNHLENVLSIRRWSTDRYLSQLRSSMKIDDLKQHAISVPKERFYNYEKNEIVLNDVLFQAPFFRSDVQNYLNFGGIGSMISREFARAFDKRGRQGWWSDISSINIENGGRCIIQQYNDYVNNATQHNGFTDNDDVINDSETRNNILIDFYGLKAAYMAYNEWVNDNGMEQLKPLALAHFTTKQLFWIRAANVLCENATNLRQTGSHYPQKFKVMGPLFNLPEFAEDFNCSQGEVMNRGENICILN